MLRIARRGTGFDIAATMERDGWVVISESAWKGWRAYIDGKRIQPHFANNAFLGIHVPRGNHRVEVVYLPESFTRGRNVSVLTLLGVVGWWVWRSKPRVPKP